MLAEDIWTKPFRLDMQYQVKNSISDVNELQIEGTTIKHYCTINNYQQL